MAHRDEDKITTTEEGENKDFKGPGIEGAKETDKQKAERKKAEKAEREARQKKLKKEHAKLSAENKRLLIEEDKAGFIDGYLVVARKARAGRIADCEAELKGLGKRR